ncbi:hypothetical protein VPH35_043456 [Triticum aestivum]
MRSVCRPAYMRSVCRHTSKGAAEQASIKGYAGLDTLSRSTSEAKQRIPLLHLLDRPKQASEVIMGGGHDMHGGHNGGVKGFVSSLVGGGKSHGYGGQGHGCDQGYGGHGQQQQHGYGGHVQQHGYGGHGQQQGYGGHGQHGYPPPAAAACPPYGGYPAQGYAPAAYPAQPAPHHGGHMGSYHTGHGGGHGHGYSGGKHMGGGKHGGRKWK